MQLAIDHISPSAVDIRNLSGSDTNTFQGNTCLTSINAPCPAVAPLLTATPNPIPVTAGALQGTTTLSWNAPGAQVIEIHIGAPDGELFTEMGYRGSISTGPWVSDGTTFYLQDVTGGKPLNPDNTLATVVVKLQRK